MRYVIQEWPDRKGIIYMVCDSARDMLTVFSSRDQKQIHQFLTCLDGK